MSEPAKILGEPFYGDDDPLGVFSPSEAAIAAMADKTLRRAGVFEPSVEQVAAAREVPCSSIGRGLSMRSGRGG
jgi:hypothetical protein